MREKDDNAVIRAVLAGDQPAFAILVERYKGLVFTLVRRHINEREAAEELAQDVFLKAYRFLSTFRGNSKFSTWLFTIVRTTCLSHLRKKQNTELPGTEKVIYFSDALQEAEQGPDPIDVKSQRLRISMALDRLDPDDREIIFHFYHAGSSVEEIAAIMKMSSANIKIRLFRSRQRLKGLLTGEIDIHK